MKKKKEPEEEIREYCISILKEASHWNDINENGCNDPFWEDGCNMNLTRNHILYYKKKIETLCQEYHIPLPSEYYHPVPPEVSDHYMANLKQKERVERFLTAGRKLVTKKTIYNESQMSFI